jgi:heme/copper-type cytochrome/quinol oxidase subunit 3
VWPAREALPPLGYPVAAGILLLASSAAVAYASRALSRNALVHTSLALAAAIVFASGAFIQDGRGLFASGLAPTDSAYGAVVYLIFSLEGFYVTVVVAMAAYTIARAIAGKLNHVRRVTFENTMLFWHYTVAQSLAGLVLVHTFPRLAG